MDQFTPIENIKPTVDNLHENFLTGITRSVEFRKHQLRQLNKLYEENEKLISQAVYNDLKKSQTEFSATEGYLFCNEIANAIKCLDEWVKPERARNKQIFLLADKVYTRREPLGVVLVIGAWNFPLLLLLNPAICAIAAGNCVVLKPSEESPHMSSLLADLIPKYMDNRVVQIVTGGVPQATRLLELKFNHICFTGGGNIGKIVMTAAAKHLTPVTLELGGKSPVIIDESNADIATVAKRLLWAKCSNAGQICVAPDYAFVHKSVKMQLITECNRVIGQFFAGNARSSPDFGRIVNKKHFIRLTNLLLRQTRENPGSDIIQAEPCDEADLFIGPTIVSNAKFTDPVMEDEIFGPILPLIEYDSLDKVISLINSRDKPLMMAIFSQNNDNINKILDHCSSGMANVNDCLVHVAANCLPFGGVGESGMGKYRGKFGFDNFTNLRAFHVRNAGLEFANLGRYPPFSKWTTIYLKTLMKEKVLSETEESVYRVIVSVWRFLFKPVFGDIRGWIWFLVALGIGLAIGKNHLK